MKGETSDVDGAGGGKIDTVDRGAWPVFNNITGRDPVADDVGLFLIEAMRLEDFVNSANLRLVGGKEA